MGECALLISVAGLVRLNLVDDGLWYGGLLAVVCSVTSIGYNFILVGRGVLSAY